MLADALRRRIHGKRATYLRVAVCPVDKPFANEVPPAAREIRIVGAPETISVATTAIESARAIAGDRTLSAFNWSDVERFASGGNDPVDEVLSRFRKAGLDALAAIPLDEVSDLAKVLEPLMKAGFEKVRLTIEKPVTTNRLAIWLNASEMQKRFGCIQALNPLPLALNAFRPTTGYDDVKMVAAARLAAPNIPTIQVDWSRYGPKLAQVALTFGADDVDGISGSDEAPEGRRRAPLEEIRRNIEAAGFEPAERDGRFAINT
jgi:aminodeoxyfutalosine synthase